MAPSSFQTIEHTVLCQHVREYPHDARPGCESMLKLAVKQYKPLQRLEPSIDAVTVIATHGNGFPKVR